MRFTDPVWLLLLIPATAGLYIDYANANNVSILIGNAANNNGDLQLSGKLTIVRGIVYVGQAAAPNNHNDIEYTGSGASEIDIQGGSLYVNGNIKRQTPENRLALLELETLRVISTTASTENKRYTA